VDGDIMKICVEMEIDNKELRSLVALIKVMNPDDKLPSLDDMILEGYQ
jgi:hypothetical protein